MTQIIAKIGNKGVANKNCIAKDKQEVIGLLKLAVLVSDSGLAGGEHVILIHVIDSVTYNLASILVQ